MGGQVISKGFGWFVALLLAAGAVWGDIRINEAVASNHNGLIDEDGESSDWLELVNTGAARVDLAGWGLSNDLSDPFLWTFPSVSLGPGAHLLVWASKKNRRPNLVAGEELILIPESTAWRYWDAGHVPDGAWQTPEFDDSAWPLGNARFGSPTVPGGTTLAKSPAAQFYPAYFFRRIFTLGAVPSAEEVGPLSIRHHFDDGAVVWLNGVEIYRYKMPPGPVSYTAYTGDGYNVDYTGGWLTNTLDKAQILALLISGNNVCAVSLHQSKPSTSDAIFDMGLRFLAGSDRELHTNFKISAGGCDLILTRSDGSVADQVAVPVMPSDCAAGRAPDGIGVWRVLPVPTPGFVNNTHVVYEGVVSAVEPSIAPGFYPESLLIKLSTATPDAEIYYTTDGSEPTIQSERYSRPFALNNRSLEPDALCLINTGTSYVTPTTPQPKACVLRAVAVRPGWMPSPLFGGTWFVGPQTASFTVPVLSIASDHANIFGPTGLYGNPDGANGNDWECPFNVEMFVDQTRVVGQIMGARIHGGYSRAMAQKTLRLYARSEYGTSTIAYPIFPDQPQFDAYKRVLLRNGGNDWAKSMIRDAVAQELCKHLRHDTQAYRPSVVFLNGEYWGVHNLRERYDARYLERVYGVDPEQVDIIGFPYGSSVPVADEGSAADFNALLTWLSSHSLTDAASYTTVTGQVDVANFMDYMLANMFVVNRDWPGNNIKFWRTRVANTAPDAPYAHDARWRWLMFDVDFAFAGWDTDPPSTDMWAWATSTTGSGRVCEAATRLFRKLLENADFRARMLTRYADQLNTAYQPRRTRAVTERIRDAVAPEMPRHIARWPGAINSMNTWSNQVASIWEYARDRHGWEWRHMCSRFSLSTVEVCVATSDMAHGRVQVNDILVDSDTLGIPDPAAPYPWRGWYFREIPVTLRALPCPGYRFVNWVESGETSATLSVQLTGAQQTFTARFELDPDAQVSQAVFLPSGEEEWDDDACWDTGRFPNWPGARAVIPPPTEPDGDGLPRRNVRVAAQAVTVGHVTVDNGTFSNRIRNKKNAPAGAALTFDGGTDAASLAVVGGGTGFTAVEVANGVMLATDLRLVVSNTVGDAEYGALRLQAGWNGPGGLIKEGPGRCTMTGDGKAYGGRTVVREGVLSMTQPAAPFAGTGVAVEPGGQLRLTSGDPLTGPPRMYVFGDAVALASNGATGADGTGGLRYAPGGVANWAAVSAPVMLAGSACIAVEDRSGDRLLANTLVLAGGLRGASPLVKRGGGRLVIAGDAADYEGVVTVADGGLQADTAMLNADVAMADGAWLCGAGRVGNVTGSGWISPGAGGAGRLHAQSVGGEVDFAFRFTTVGDDSTGNDTLALQFSAAPFSRFLDADNRVHVYLDTLPPEDGYVLGGFETASPEDFTRWIALASWCFFAPDPYGSETFEGQTYAPCPVALDLSTVAVGTGRRLKISRPAHGYAAWCAERFTLAERLDAAVSGPLAVDADGVANLLRYALGAGRAEPITPYLPRLDRDAGALVYAYRTRVDDPVGLTYLVVCADDLTTPTASWSDVRSDTGLTARLLDVQATDDPALAVTRLEIIPGPNAPVRFFKLRVQQP
ncbi:MAG TPA: CotH kinase family protein [Kiritimatiellia bacterium]|nr:CotH kinase family protein [Kiritimatiellia bacterium]